MKILHIFDDYGTPGEKALPGIGSVPSVVYYLAKHTVKKGHDVTILERGHDRSPEEEYIDGIRYVRVKAEKLPYAPYRLIKSPSGVARLLFDSISMALKINGFLKKEDFDVVHVHFPFAACVLVNINRKIREKTVYTAHMDEYRLGLSKYLRPPIVARLFSPDVYLIKRVKKGIVLNENIKSLLVTKKNLEDDKLEVIPNGINVREFNINIDEVERVKKKYRLNGVVVMFAGTITPRKGVEFLVKASEIVLKDIKNVTFLIVGNLKLDDVFARRIIDYVRSKKLNIKFTGYIPYKDLKALYSACDIFVLPSLEEGHGIVLTEAMASGKPLIGSNIGGIPMQIKDGWNGFLVEPRNERQLADRIRYLIENKEERRIMGKNSRKLAEEVFDWWSITGRYINIYKAIFS